LIASSCGQNLKCIATAPIKMPVARLISFIFSNSPRMGEYRKYSMAIQNDRDFKENACWDDTFCKKGHKYQMGPRFWNYSIEAGC